MPSPEADKVGFREFLRLTRWVISVSLRTSRLWTSLKIICSALNEIQGLIYSLIFAKALDALIQVAQTPDKSFNDLLPYLFILFGYALFNNLNNFVLAYSNRYLRIVGRAKMRELVYIKLHKLGIQTLEKPEVENKLSRMDENLGYILPMMDQTTTFISRSFSIISSGAVIVATIPFIIPILIAVVVPQILLNRHFSRRLWKFDLDTTEGKRKAGTAGSWLSESRALQEISINGGYSYFLKYFQEYYDWWSKKWLKLRTRWALMDSIMDLVATGGVFLGYAFIFAKLLAREISVGDVTFQMRALDIFQGDLTSLSSVLSDMQEFAVRLRDIFQLLTYKSDIEDGVIELPRLETPPEIELESVDFHYPSSEKLIFKDLNLKITSGEKIAIVGHNGAGKTTLVKLLGRLYVPSAGRIMISGMNLNGLKIDDWYKNMGVLFQDFNTYGFLSAKQNIYLGRPSKPINEEQIIEAAKNADAHDFIEEFPDKYDQVLNEKYKGGIRPSAGMWQKIAIARFFYRNAPLVIFDEPTAAIDAVSEYKIFNRIYKFFKNKTVIIISHRFSTVRNADRIIVMDKGQVAEEGTHEELMAKNGKYAHAFKLQAEGYQH